MADQHTPTAENIEELEALAAAAVRDEPLELGVTVDDVLVHATASNGDALLLLRDELELLESARNSRALEPDQAVEDPEDYPARLARMDIAALERLGRIRVRLVIYSETRPETITPERAVELAWRKVAAALADRFTPASEVESGVNAYLNLRTHAGNGRRATELVELAQAETRAITRRAVAVLEEAKGLGADTFEGRLETLGVRINELGEVAG